MLMILGRGVMVTLLTLDQTFMVRIHASQFFQADYIMMMLFL